MTEADIIIRKFKNGNISSKLVNANEVEHNSMIYSADALWKEDLYFHTDEAGWLHLVDINQNKVYQLTDYGYNCIEELRTGKTVKIYPMRKEDALEILNEWRKE